MTFHSVLPDSSTHVIQFPQFQNTLLAFTIASFLAVGAGCFVVASPGLSARNAAAWAIGAALAFAIARLRSPHFFSALLLLTPLALLLTQLQAGQSGVHRWIALGPLTWNAAFLFLPAATVAIAARSNSRWSGGAALLIALALYLQPDASQATAFAAAMILTLFSTPARLLATLVAALTWLRPDPLQPVPEVEGIVELARSVSLASAILSVASLAAATLAPLAAPPVLRRPALALSIYFVTCALMPLAGAFPVPLVGMGMSPIIGFWLGIGALFSMSNPKDSAIIP